MPNEHEELLPIGRLARRSGLSVKALRHCERVGVLRPAHVDPATGYRRYLPAQVERARRIRRLRELEVPLDRIRAILAAQGPGAQALLEEHRTSIEARTWRLQGIRLRQLSQGKESTHANRDGSPNPRPGDRAPGGGGPLQPRLDAARDGGAHP